MPRSLAAISTYVTLLKVKMVSVTLAQQNPRLSQMEYFIIRSEIEDIKFQFGLIRSEVIVLYFYLFWSVLILISFWINAFLILTAIAEVNESDSKTRRDMEIPSCKFWVWGFASSFLEWWSTKLSDKNTRCLSQVLHFCRILLQGYLDFRTNGGGDRCNWKSIASWDLSINMSWAENKVFSF